jgi:hypothetical protein
MGNKRDATASAKGYDYQFCYLMNLIVSHYNDETYSFEYEGNEDIDIHINNNLHTLIQVKYHSKLDNLNENEILTKNGGLTKVYNYFLENYEKLQNITKIKYSITNEKDCKLITSPKIYEEYIKSNKNIYDILKDRSEFNENDSILKHFCNILEFDFIPDKSIADIIDDIRILINASYLYTKLNTNIKSEYKTEYILSLLHKNIRKYIYSQPKCIIQIKDIIENIKNQINNNYKEEILIDEIIELLNSQDITQISTLLKNRIINITINDTSLINKYKLLRLKTNNIDLLNTLKNNIHKESIILFSNLLSDKNENLSQKEIKRISHSISHILNSSQFTTKMNTKLKKYFKKCASLKCSAV